MRRYPGFGITTQLGDRLNEYSGPGDVTGFGDFDATDDAGDGGGLYEVGSCWFGGELYVIFVEVDASDSAGRGPLVKKWDGSAWVLVGTDMEPSASANRSFGGGVLTTPPGTGDRFCPSRPQICTDGTTLFAAYSVRVGAVTPDAEPNWDARALVVKYFDGSDWVLIAEVDAETYNTWPGAGLFAGQARGGFGRLISIGATPDLPGQVYASWYEEGPQSGLNGAAAHNWRQRWHCAGWATDGSSVFDQDVALVDLAGGVADVIGTGSNLRYEGVGHRFARGNGTLYLAFQSPDALPGDLSLLDVSTGTTTEIPVGAAVNINGNDYTNFQVGVTAVSEPRTPGSGPEMILFAPLFDTANLVAAQVATDLSSDVEVIHGDNVLPTWPLAFAFDVLGGSIVDGLHQVDDKNAILVIYNVAYFGYQDGHSFTPGVWHENCGPAIQLGFNTPGPGLSDSGTRRLTSQFDPDALELYVASTLAADGSVVVFEQAYLPDAFSCAGNPTFNRVIPV